jgi:quinol monooxygenase YgiN
MSDIKYIRLNCPLILSNKDKTEELIKSAKELVSQTLKNDEGVEDYDLFQSQTNPNKFLIFETWKNQTNLSAHMNKEHFKKAVPIIQKLGEMKIEQINVEKENPKTFKLIRMNCPLEVKNGKEEEVLKDGVELVNKSLKDEGVIDYDILKSCTRNKQFLIFETWKNQDCLNKHMNSEHFKKLVPKIQENGNLKIDQLFIV